jgi:hypothetical protein
MYPNLISFFVAGPKRLNDISYYILSSLIFIRIFMSEN